MIRRLLPNSLSGQFILLIVVALIASQVLNVYLLMGERQFIARSAHLDRVIDRMLEEATSLPDYSKRDLPLVLVDGDEPRGSIFLSTQNRSQAIPDGKPNAAFAKTLAARLAEAGVTTVSTSASVSSFAQRGPPGSAPPRRGPGARPGPGPRGGPPPPEGRRPGPPPRFHPSTPPAAGGPPAPGFEEIVLSAELEPGIWLNALAPYYATEAITSRAIWTTALTLAGAILAAIILARQIGRPIRDLGTAAQALGRGETVAPLIERGPRDVAAATQAFNRMQERLMRIIETQRATLRAVGHDLRTPLTGLRIRAESVPEDHGRDKMIASIEQLTAMTEEILSWSKDASGAEDLALVDLSALLDSIAQDYADRGDAVSFEAPDGDFLLSCRRIGLRRALNNVIDNALKYAGNAELRLAREHDHICINVIDDGPGIPREKLEDVLTPFTRLEPSRNRETGGSGLGLSIAQSILLAQGGTLTLKNTDTRGLCVEMCLPLS